MDWTLIITLAVVPIFVLVLRMSEPEKMIRPIPGGLTPEQQGRLLQYRDWLASQGLAYRTSFQFGSIRVAVFQQGDLPRYFSFMFHQRLTYSAESYLHDLTILDTSTSGSLGLFPRPGAYAQSFPGVRPEEMWQRHVEGEEELSRKFGYQ